ncbi:TonB-dependent receptor [Chitinophaga silvatica]|uniref:TonB-dependent receptor n=1 Tax=Chitinophaga silvatica TaxID=2282649 RepID=A0A3E1YI59_9BACT|nr:outer membrane beta-barrel family protein [Chitinophaga silvatica]RFS26930.1 TonB-dependent receptor [Chitinophaga silvatica]
MPGKKYISLLTLLIISLGLNAQIKSVTVSGVVKDADNKKPMPYVNVVLKLAKDSSFITGSVTNENGRFSLPSIKPDNYLLTVTYTGYLNKIQPIFVGSLSEFIEMDNIEIQPNVKMLREVNIVAGKPENVDSRMDKKVYSVANNISQAGGSILQAMQNLPGVTVQDGKVQLRGNDKVVVLIDGKQTALTGFGSQTALDNIPSSAIERIEIINNPSSKYDANGNAGIINIIMKKNKEEGFNGKVGLATGLGSLWERQANLPGIRPQYHLTPKINPSLSLNYRKEKINTFLQLDNLYTQTLNKNEFVTRTYEDGEVVQQQTKRNRNTNFFNSKAGIDWQMNESNTFQFSGLFGTEKIIDRGDQPFFNANLTERRRLWQFLEDELKTTVMGIATWQHKFKEPGHLFNAGFNYTFHREDEKYFFDNIMPAYTGKDAFKLLSDEHVADLNIDYIRPLKYGRIETGLKFRYRNIPTDMLFIPGIHSPLDTTAGGWATYKETIPAIYGNYIFENNKYEAEIGMRVEYVNIEYIVNPEHNTYKSSGYNYMQPFPNIRLAYKFNDRNKISAFYTRRVDRPNEVDIRIFPKYDDAEIIKVGNPELRPQFTNSIELGYKTSWQNGSFYGAAYYKFANGTITRISSIIPESNLIYAIFQNAGRSSNSGLEAVFSQKASKTVTVNLNMNGYRNMIDAFTVENKYPKPNTYSAAKESIISGNIKLNTQIRLPQNIEAQITAIYLAPDIIPQGKIGSRFSIDLGTKKVIQKGKGEVFLNATDLLNTMVIKKEIRGQGFSYTSKDFYETQVVRIGYNYKF